MYHKKTQSALKHWDFALLDLLCLQIAIVLAYMTRHGLSNIYAEDNYRDILVVYALADIAVLAVNNTLRNVLKRGYFKELLQTATHVFVVSMLIQLYMFSIKGGAEYSRIVIYLAAAYYFVSSYLVRILWKLVVKKSASKKLSAIYFVTVSDRAEDMVTGFLKNNPGYLAKGICLLDRNGVGEEIAGIPVTAGSEDLLRYLCDKWVDAVYVCVPVGFTYPENLIDALVEMGITVHVETEHLPGAQWHKQIFEKMGGKTVRTIGITMATTGELVFKRALDILGGLVGCAITGVLVLILGPMIYIKSPGPIFFAQTRVGRHGKKFKMYKFRSMYMDAEARKAELMKENRVKDGMMFKLDFDPRIIGAKRLPDGTVKKGLGNFIRDWSLDEFPQFFNVLKGDLSLVGTRPPTVDEWEKYELHHRARLAIKPGITGMWQVSGRSSITDFEQVVALDKEYICNWSLGLDLRILLKTFKAVLTKDGSM